MENIKELIEAKEASIESKKLEIQEKQNEINSYEYECKESDFDDFLNELYGDVNICGHSYSSSQAFKEVDRTAYNCAKSDYESNFDLSNCKEYTNLESELEDLESELEDLESELEDLESKLED